MHDSATAPEIHPLDNPGSASLRGAHAGFALVQGRARAYAVDVSRFNALPDDPTAADWADLAVLVRRTGEPHAALVAPPAAVPQTWTPTFFADCLQLIGTHVATAADPEAVVLTEADSPEMLDLVARTNPGPFEPHTYRLGTYLGIRREGRLVAMVGERMHPPGFTEISAVCTDPAFRGQRLGGRLIRAITHHIEARGETAFLHSVATNEAALRLYAALGFVVRREIAVAGFAPPAPPTPT